MPMEISKVTHNVVISYSDGREDVYPLACGQAILGSSADCFLGVQAKDVEPHHVVFSKDGESIAVKNLCNPCSVLLNGVPIDGCRPLKIGDELAIGSVRVRIRRALKLQRTFNDDKKLAGSPDGVTNVVGTIRRDQRLGWRGARKILEKVAPFISPEEAEAAEREHSGRFRILRRCFLAIIANAIAIGILALCFKHAQSHAAVEVVILAWAISLFYAPVLVLTARYRIQFAGRMLYPCLVAVAVGVFPSIDSQDSQWIPLALIVAFLWGWLCDIGAGCIFAKTRSGFIGRYLLLLYVISPMLMQPFMSDSSGALAVGLAILLLLMLIAYPCWAKFLVAHGVEERIDVIFVADMALRRTVRRWIARTVAVFAVGMPFLLALSALGICERLIWEESSDLIVTETESGERVALFWADRGRNLRKSDFATSLIFRVPYDILAAPKCSEGATVENFDSAVSTNAATLYNKGSDGMAIVEDKIAEKVTDTAARILGRARESAAEHVPGVVTNGISLTAFGQTIVDRIARIHVDPTNRMAYVQLLEELTPYRVTAAVAESSSTDMKWVSNASWFYLEDVAAGENLRNALYYVQDWSDSEVLPLSQRDAHAMAESIGATVTPCFVLLVIGGFVLWKRGADSAVGFWLGIGMTATAFGAFAFYENDGINLIWSSVQYYLRHWAVHSYIGLMVASLLGSLYASGKYLMYLSLLSQSILFVLLCWHGQVVGHSEWWEEKEERFLAFAGRVGLLLIIGVLVSFFSKGSGLVLRMAVILTIGFVGSLLRRKCRYDTEAPELGWMFFWGWLLLEIAVIFPKQVFFEGAIVPVSWWDPLSLFGIEWSLARLIAGISAIIGGILFCRLFLRRNFLALTTPSAFTFAMFSFSIPILSEVFSSLVEKAFSGSFLQSELGERVASLSVIVLILRPLWDMLERLSRRLSVRNIIRVESEINTTLETVLDQAGTVDARDAIFATLRDLGLERYAFYARSSSDSFNLILSNNWKGQVIDSFSVSSYLRRYLGANPHVVDLNRLAHEESVFFQSFELFRIGRHVHASCLLPICLGRSVRAILVTPIALRPQSLPNNEVFVESVNALGLATVSTLSSRGPSMVPTNAVSRPYGDSCSNGIKL